MIVPILGTIYDLSLKENEAVRIISRRTLVEFWSDPAHQAARRPLSKWFSHANKANWGGPQDIKAEYANASFLAGNRVVFNIGGDKYRLIVKFNYAHGIGYIRFVGTHEAYDRIDATNI